MMQIRTYRDGTRWLRWLASDRARVADTAPRLHANTVHCAVCTPEHPDWSQAPAGSLVPKVDLVYACDVCGNITLQGRLATPR